MLNTSCSDEAGILCALSMYSPVTLDFIVKSACSDNESLSSVTTASSVMLLKRRAID